MEYKVIQSGFGLLEKSIQEAAKQGFRPILITSTGDSNGGIISLVIMERSVPSMLR
jgi:hypothetical protein